MAAENNMDNLEAETNTSINTRKSSNKQYCNQGTTNLDKQ